jgi:hypothetical protein
LTKGVLPINSVILFAIFIILFLSKNETALS